MKNKISKTIVLWPVDAFHCDKAMVKKVHSALKRFFGSNLPPVLPVYVLTPESVTKFV